MIMTESTGGGQEEKPFSFSVRSTLTRLLKNPAAPRLCHSPYTILSNLEPGKPPLALCGLQSSL